jgi:outer membrane protein, heavy metal efflux system
LRTLLFTLFCLAPGLAPLPQAPPPLTVDDAVALAIQQNPHLSAAARDVVASRAGVRSARALTNPEVTLLPALTGPGGSDQELLLRQPLELNGTRAARTGIAAAQLRQSQADAVVELRGLVAATKSAYYELARAQEQGALTQDLLRTAEEFDRITRRQVDLGARPGIDRTQTGIQVARAQQQTIQADSEVSSALAALNTLMGRRPAEPLGALPPLGFTPEPVDGEVAMRQALAARAEITAAAATGEALRQQVRLARAQGRPDLVPQFRATSVTRGLRDYGVGVGISLPLLDYGSRHQSIRQADEAFRAQEDRVTATQNQVRQEVEQAITRLHAADAVVRNYRQGVLDQTRRLLDASRVGFQAGQTNVIAVLEAQRTYYAVQTEYITALASHAQARAELERATGAVAPDRVPDPEARKAQ